MRCGSRARPLSLFFFRAGIRRAGLGADESAPSVFELVRGCERSAHQLVPPQMEMSFRHAAALALVGWYLMLPPEHLVASATKGTPYPDAVAPLSKWGTVKTFDRPDDCEADIRRRQQEADEADLKGANRLWAFAYQCVASDDPRLKSN